MVSAGIRATVHNFLCCSWSVALLASLARLLGLHWVWARARETATSGEHGGMLLSASHLALRICFRHGSDSC
jgi:hypothetical protein